MKFNIYQFIILFGLLSFASCKNEKVPEAVVGEAKKVAKANTAATYPIDASVSKVFWTGSKPTGSHTGTINIAKGRITTNLNQIVAGSFILDMTSITSTDLEGDKKAGLEAHLKGQRKPEEIDDFFNVVKYPTAQFDITKVTKLVNDPNSTHLVYGNLTIKEVTKEIGIKAKVTVENGLVMVEAPEFSINRTDWGIKFMSKNFFDNLKDNFIDDDIKLSISLKTKA